MSLRLQGQALSPTQTLQEVVAACVCYSPGGMPLLARPINADVVAALDQAITLACRPSPSLSSIVRSVVANSNEELAAAARIREMVGVKGNAASGTAEAVAQLSEAIASAGRFARLVQELEAAVELRDKWLQRASAVEKLEAAVEEVRRWGPGRRPGPALGLMHAPASIFHLAQKPRGGAVLLCADRRTVPVLPAAAAW